MRPKNPIRLSELPQARKILDEIQRELMKSGESIAQFSKHGDSELIRFDVLIGLSVFDHGKTNQNIHCIACPTHPALQYEFIIEDVDGQLHNPIGSTCILKRSLGEVAAEIYGSRLREEARKYFQKGKKINRGFIPLSAHDREHRNLFRSARNIRAYFIDLELDWLVLACLQGDRWVEISAEDRQLIRGILEHPRPLSEEEFKRFQDLTIRRKSQIFVGRPRITDPVSIPELPSLPPKRKVKSTSIESERQVYKVVSGDSPLELEDWESYLKGIGRNYSESELEIFLSWMTVPDAERIAKKYADRMPLDGKDESAFAFAYKQCQGRMEHRPDHAYRPRIFTEKPSLYEASLQLWSFLPKQLTEEGYDHERDLFRHLPLRPADWLIVHVKDVVMKVRNYEVVALRREDLAEVARALRQLEPTTPQQPS